MEAARRMTSPNLWPRGGMQVHDMAHWEFFFYAGSNMEVGEVTAGTMPEALSVWGSYILQTAHACPCALVLYPMHKHLPGSVPRSPQVIRMPGSSSLFLTALCGSPRVLPAEMYSSCGPVCLLILPIQHILYLPRKYNR